MMGTIKTLAVALLSIGAAAAQQELMIVDIGQAWRPVEFMLSPGQLVALEVHGAGGDLKNRVARTFPLPFEVEGISVTISDEAGKSYQVPILALEPLPACYTPGLPDSIPCGTVVGITIQVPYELEFRPQTARSATLVTVYEAGKRVAVTPYRLLERNFFVVTGHDAVSILFRDLDLASMLPIVRRPDGSLVSSYNRALPGEMLTLLAVGLGYDFRLPAQRPATGQPAKEGVKIPIGGGYDLGIGVDFQFGKNPVADTQHWVKNGVPSIGLLKAELVPGLPGIYEITVQVPKEIPRDTPSCSGGADYNLSIVLGYLTNRHKGAVFDSARICVALP